MDMKKVAFAVLVAAVCMTAVMAASKPLQPKAVVDVPPKTGDAPAPAPKEAKASGDTTPSPSPVTEEGPVTSTGSAESGSNSITTLPGDAPNSPITTEAPAPAPSSANTLVGSLAGASLVSFLALYM